MNYGIEEHGDKARPRYGSRWFYELLSKMSVTHDKKSHDYASNDAPYANYEFGGKLALMFPHSALDAGFVSRIGEKLFRLANLESSNKLPLNESIADTEDDLAVIMTLWMASRKEKREKDMLANEKYMTKSARDIPKDIPYKEAKYNDPNSR